MAKTHFTAEGEVTFKSILFVPKTSPTDWQNQSKNKVWSFLDFLEPSHHFLLQNSCRKYWKTIEGLIM